MWISIDIIFIVLVRRKPTNMGILNDFRWNKHTRWLYIPWALSCPYSGPRHFRIQLVGCCSQIFDLKKKKTLGMCRNTEIGYMDISYMCVSIHVITCDYMCVFIEILVFMLFPSMYYCGWLRNPAPVDRWFIKGFNHPRWCRISSIHSMSVL